MSEFSGIVHKAFLSGQYSVVIQPENRTEAGGADHSQAQQAWLVAEAEKGTKAKKVVWGFEADDPDTLVVLSVNSVDWSDHKPKKPQL